MSDTMKYELLKAYLQGVLNKEKTFGVLHKEELEKFIKKIEENS